MCDRVHPPPAKQIHPRVSATCLYLPPRVSATRVYLPPACTCTFINQNIPKRKSNLNDNILISYPEGQLNVREHSQIYAFFLEAFFWAFFCATGSFLVSIPLFLFSASCLAFCLRSSDSIAFRFNVFAYGFNRSITPTFFRGFFLSVARFDFRLK